MKDKDLFNFVSQKRKRVPPAVLKALVATPRTASLRDRIIRLAHAKPHLRPYLLPLLKK